MKIQDAADRLGVTPARVRRLIADDRLRARKDGEGTRGNWYLDPAAVEAFAKLDRPPGRPRRCDHQIVMRAGVARCKKCRRTGRLVDGLVQWD
jgi:hypothetical protein